MAAVRVVVHGEVQGVFFRDECRQKAQAAGVADWVRNDSTGTVEAVFEGHTDAVDRMVQWCKSGRRKPGSSASTSPTRTSQALPGFEVRD